MNLDESEVKRIKAYLFEDNSLYDKNLKNWRRFDADAAIAQSWQRLAEGKTVFKHDKTLIYHEILEMKIKKENPDISHEEAHERAQKIYNYKKESEEYYDRLRKHKENR